MSSTGISVFVEVKIKRLQIGENQFVTFGFHGNFKCYTLFNHFIHIFEEIMKILLTMNIEGFGSFCKIKPILNPCSLNLHRSVVKID